MTVRVTAEFILRHPKQVEAIRHMIQGLFHQIDLEDTPKILRVQGEHHGQQALPEVSSLGTQGEISGEFTGDQPSETGSGRRSSGEETTRESVGRSVGKRVRGALSRKK